MKRQFIQMCVGLFVLLFAVMLRGDELKIGGFWIANVQVQAVEQGQIIYQTPRGSEVVKPLTEIEGVRLSDYPPYQQAAEALADGHPDEAAKLLESLDGKVRSDWASAFIGASLWRAHAEAGHVSASVKAYAELAAAGADPFFLSDPPVAVVAESNARQKSRIQRTLKAAIRKASNEMKPLLQVLLEASETVEPKQPVPADATDPPDAADSVADDSAVVLPVKLQESQATKLLRAGQFGEALEQIDLDLKQQGNLAVDLYLQGIGLLYQADTTDDAAGYEDAGLAFMRVMTYFPQSNFSGRNLIAGSLLELAYIHDQLGAAAKATELYDRVANEIDEEFDLNLYQRLQQLRQARL